LSAAPVRPGPPFTTIVRDLPASVPFVGPEAIERRRGRPLALRLGANESAFGVSPRAARAMRDEVERVSWYGDPENHALRAALADQHGVAIDEVCVGAGIDELLGLTVRMLVEPGQPVVTSLGAYPTFNYHVAGYGARPVTVPYRDDHEDPEALLEAVRRERAPLAYLANPDNPMGTWHGRDVLARLIAGLPHGAVLVLDEAYTEFAPAQSRPPVDTANPQVLRMRTFSKAHGMAGARIGYAIGARAVIAGFEKVRNHFGMSRIAQAGALASLRDPDFLRGVVAEVARGREDYYRLARDLGLAVIESATNFVAVDVGGGDRARVLVDALAARDVFVRMPGVAPLDRCIRVSVGTADERRRFAAILPDALAAIGPA